MMLRLINPIRFHIIVLLGTSFPITGFAMQSSQGISFNGHAYHYKTHWDYQNNSQRETKVTRLGIGWEEPLTSYLSAGINAGYLDISQATNPIDEGKVTTGHYLGLFFHALPLNQEYVQLHFNLQYTYNAADTAANTQTVEYRWHNTLLSTQLDIKLLHRLKLLIGGKLSWIDGEERSTGTTTQVLSFNEKQNGGYYAGFNLATDASGHVSLIWESGLQKGVHLIFSRRF